MGVRLTTYPLKLHFRIVESSGNTFTPGELDTPVGQLSMAGKVQAMEVMAVIYDLQGPSIEAGQGNTVEVGITTQVQAAQPEFENPDVVWMQVSEVSLGTANHSVVNKKSILRDNQDDNDGNGVIVYVGTLHTQITGTGNAAARFCAGYLLYHLTAITAKDVVQDLLTA